MHIAWPVDLRPSRWFLRVDAVTAMFQSPFTGQVQVLERPNQLWYLDATFQTADWDKYRKLQTICGMLRGGASTVGIPLWDHEVPNGTWSGTPTVSGIAGRSVTITGLDASDQNAIKAGDVIKLSGGQIVQCVYDVSSNESGAAVATVEPLPRDAFVSAYQAFVVGQSITMRLVPGSKPSGDLARGPRASLTLKFLEAF